jgi:hypothetical protein
MDYILMLRTNLLVDHSSASYLRQEYDRINTKDYHATTIDIVSTYFWSISRSAKPICWIKGKCLVDTGRGIEASELEKHTDQVLKKVDRNVFAEFHIDYNELMQRAKHHINQAMYV